jgi:hypothetical protein
MSPVLTLPPASIPPAAPGTTGAAAPAEALHATADTGPSAVASPVVPPSPSAVASTSAVALPGALSSPENLRELHLLWSRVRGAAWRSLVLVPAEPGVSGLRVAEGLLQAARVLSPHEPLQLLDARGLLLDDVAVLTRRLAAQVATGQRVLLVADSPLESSATLALAHAADAGLLCARLGMDLRRARQTLALCGRERFVGSVLVPA